MQNGIDAVRRAEARLEPREALQQTAGSGVRTSFRRSPLRSKQAKFLVG